ncbi:MAG: hypothetical protein ACHQUC_09050 [Chlamydiales bacterium]
MDGNGLSIFVHYCPFQSIFVHNSLAQRDHLRDHPRDHPFENKILTISC